ncbi:MAG: ATPase [Acidimicrobiaceae bacterium]|nr:ATPase [Acidimicrobiaceae bacterium]
MTHDSDTTNPSTSGAPTPDERSDEVVPWHRFTTDETLSRLDSSRDGLASVEAERRLDEYGRNELEEKGGKSPWRIVWEQLSAVMVLILIGAALLSLLLGKYLEAGAIGAIVVLFAALGFIQEYRAEQAIAALRRMTVPIVRVIRDGKQSEVPSLDLVPGDVVALEAGSVVPADLRLLDTANLRVQEAALTGESEAVDKQSDPADRDDLPLGDRRSMAYSGTQVTYGRGTGVVVATGMRTELGKIATLLQDVTAERTPLQDRLDRVGKQLALAGLVVAGLVVAMGAAGGESATDLVLTAISVAVAVIPEGLPAVVTFTLAVGAQRMLKREALIRKLPAVETLGSVTIICSDKTGTLTQNRMTVTMVDVAGHRTALSDLESELDEHPAAASVVITLVAGSLCNDTSIDTEHDGSDGEVGDAPRLLGDPTETAIVDAAERLGIDIVDLRERLPRRAEHPFDSERKRMSTVHDSLSGSFNELAALPQDAPLAFVKGSVDGLLDRCAHAFDDGRLIDLDGPTRERIEEANAALATDGMRVLGVAYHRLDETVGVTDGVDAIERDLVFVGLVGMIDPPRDEVRAAVSTCRAAGIRPIMITGDHPLTALAIARELGISDGAKAITGAELDHLSDEELAQAVVDVDVFARVSPEHKLRIVQQLQSQGHVVAMTGDGVNDAPALKRADIGVAMGITGTDVSKEASEMVLRDDNFATIVAAVEEGRVIYDNLRRFVSFAVAGNLGKIIVMLGWPIPYLLAGGEMDDTIALLPLQLLWLNLMTDGLLGFAMGVEPAEPGVMQRPPHKPGQSLWSGGAGLRTVWIGTVIGAAALAVGFAYYEADRPEWQTMMFTSLAFLQVFQAIGTRSETESVFTIGLFTNRVMVGIVTLVVGLQLAALYTPLSRFLDLESLGAADLALSIGLGVALLATMETVKAIGRARRRTTPAA